MNTAPNTPGENFVPPADPNEVPALFKEYQEMEEKGTLHLPNVPLLGQQVMDDMKSGLLTRTDFDSWTREPWKAYDTLAGRINTPEGEEGDAMRHLQDWYFAGHAFENEPEQKDAALKLWKNEHPEEAARVNFMVTKLHERISEEIAIAEATKQSREKEAKGNILENAVTGTWEYLRDWQDHKTMTVALLFAGYMLYKNLKGRRITNYLGIAIGVGAVGVFLREKFGIKPAEALAKGADSVGMNKLGDFVRETRDTIMRPFADPEDKSETAFMVESLNVTGENEQAMFRAFSAENPREYLEWYDEAKRWSLDKSSSTPPQLPKKMAGEIAHMKQKGKLPPTFDSMDRAQQTYLVLQLSDTFFDRIAQYVDPKMKGDVATKRANAIAYIREKYVTGEYYDRMYNEWLTEWKKEYAEDTGAYARLSDRAKDIADWLKEKSQDGSEQITFAGVLRLEMPDSEQQKLEAFNGPGKSLYDLYSMTESGFKKGMDTSVNIVQRIKEYVIEDVPEAARKLWKEVVEPTAGKFVDEQKFIDWTNNFAKQYVHLLKNPGESWEMVVDSEIGQALRTIGVRIKETADGYWPMMKEDAKLVYEKLKEFATSIKELPQNPNIPEPFAPTDDTATPPPVPLSPSESGSEKKKEPEGPVDELVKPE